MGCRGIKGLADFEQQVELRTTQVSREMVSEYRRAQQALNDTGWATRAAARTELQRMTRLIEAKGQHPVELPQWEERYTDAHRSA